MRNGVFFLSHLEKRGKKQEEWQKLFHEDETITGFNVGINIGESAGQSVFHVHVHLIPRRDGDVDNPRGGVRHVVPCKGDYTE